MENSLYKKGAFMNKILITLLVSFMSLFAYGDKNMGQDTQFGIFIVLVIYQIIILLVNFGQLYKVNI